MFELTYRNKKVTELTDIQSQKVHTGGTKFAKKNKHTCTTIRDTRVIRTKQVFDKFYSFFPYKRGEFYTNRLWIQNMHIVCKKLDGIMEISCILKHSSVHTCITFAFSRACLLTIKKLKEYTIVLLFKWKVNIWNQM